MSSMDQVLNSLRKQLDDLLPPEAMISSINFEGPFLVLYSQAPEYLLENGITIKNLAKQLRKRIVIRSDLKVRMPEADAEKIIQEIVPKEAEITAMDFDAMLGEVTIEAKKPGLVIGQSGNVLREITKKVFWRPVVVRTLPMRSSVISSIRNIYQKESITRKDALSEIGKRIHRPLVFPNSEYVRITSLGGSGEVGRSCLLLETKESKILVDTGAAIGTGSPQEIFPFLDAPEFAIESLDSVIVTHAHLAHSLFVPYLYKYGFSGPVYCNDATSSLMTMLQKEYIEVSSQMEFLQPYSQKDIVSEIVHTIPRRYGEVTDIAPDIRLTLSPAGHILGSSIIHLHIGEGKNNIVVATDFKFARNRLLSPANAKFPRLETLIMESTYGASRDIFPARRDAEQQLIDILARTLRRGGKALIPAMAVGLVQELQVTLDNAIQTKLLPEVPIYLDGNINEASAIYCTFPEYLAPELQTAIFSAGQNPFQASWFVPVDGRSKRQEVLEKGPSIILAPSEMLTSGPAVEYFHELAPDAKNTIVFTRNPEEQEKTLGRRILSGIKEVRWFSGGKMQMTQVNLEVCVVDGFSGHSDRNQLLNYIRRVAPKPKQILLTHGQRQKSLALKQTIHERLRIDTAVLGNMESIRLG
ncbi:MAG TPA: beta-CASP ribonuclease aCPSF1 [Candidatus Hodarchaeales archaeon]|nr:beta-CASP ribonuclease aCPSF1 [Candidatus Hodarchaeales archaeon]